MASIDDITPGTWTIDASHTTVGFTARHLMITKVRGRFGAVEGAATIAEDRLQSSVQATIELASIDTGDAGRDEHLRGADFFDVANHPSITFASTGIKEDGGDFVLFGDLTIKGITKPVELDLEFDGVSGDPWGGTRAGFTAEGEINRKDWGLEWNVALEGGGVLVGEKIKLQPRRRARQGLTPPRAPAATGSLPQTHRSGRVARPGPIHASVDADPTGPRAQLAGRMRSQVMGSSAKPSMRLEFTRGKSSGSPSTRRPSKRVRICSNMIRASSRARLAPRQKCGPPAPKATWSLGSRVRSSASGSANARSSRLAEA